MLLAASFCLLNRIFYARLFELFQNDLVGISADAPGEMQTVGQDVCELVADVLRVRLGSPLEALEELPASMATLLAKFSGVWNCSQSRSATNAASASETSLLTMDPKWVATVGDATSSGSELTIHFRAEYHLLGGKLLKYMCVLGLYATAGVAQVRFEAVRLEAAVELEYSMNKFYASGRKAGSGLVQ